MALIEQKDLFAKLSQIPHYADEENDVLVPLREIKRLVEQMPAVDAVQIVRCWACENCTLLADGVGFYCKEWHTDFYAPRYDVATYFCGDGKRRDASCS